MPQWEHINTKFDIDYTDSKKCETVNILANWKLSKLYKMLTNGSFLGSLDSGAGYVIPDLKVQK